MSLDMILSNAASGLAVSSNALAVLSHNVANAGTPDYIRETATQTSVQAGGVGDGARVGVTQRDLDAHLQAAVFTQNSVTAGLTTRQSALAGVDAVQGTTATGTDLASLLGDLQNSFTTLQNDPSNQAQQSAVVDAAGTLATQISDLAGAVTSARQNAQDDAVSAVADANTALAQIGTLNSSIVNAKAAGQSIADLQNQRDAAIDTLNRIIPVTVLTQTSGAVSLVASGRYVLPTGAASGTGDSPLLSLASSTIGTGSTAEATQPDVMLGTLSITSGITGGRLGADLALRDTTLPTYAAGLDEFAHTLATRFDAQGLTLFTDSSGTVPSSTGATAQSGYLGFATTIEVNPVALSTPSVVRDGLSGSTATTASGLAGDTTLIDKVLKYTFGADSASGTAQTAPSTTGLGASGTLSLPYAAPSTLSDFASNLVGSMSGDAADTQTQLSSASALATTLQSKLTSSSGVSVDTELSHMVQLQNAYAANGKVVAAVEAMWNTLNAMVI